MCRTPFLLELSDRIVSFVAEIQDRAFATVRQRISRHLLDLASQHQRGPELVAPISQQDLADSAGTVREMVVRVLRQLRAEGTVVTRRHGIVILAPDRLLTGMVHAPPTGTKVADAGLDHWRMTTATVQRTTAGHGFPQVHPGFDAAAVADLRSREYGRLDADDQAYLDYTGGGLYARSQLAEHHALLARTVLGNPAFHEPRLQHRDELRRARTCGDPRLVQRLAR